MQAAHRLIIVVTGLLIQVRVQVLINASKVVSTCILFWSAWVTIFEHLWLPSGVPVICLTPVHACVGACVKLSTGTHFCSSFVCTALYFINMTTNCQINRSFMKSFDQLFIIRWVCGSHKVKATWSANQKIDADATKIFLI